MAEEGEMESIVPSAVNTGGETGALVEVKFEKNPYQTKKYLEAEPKALGVTQIMLSVFYLSVIGLNGRTTDNFIPVILCAVFSSVSIIAGSVAIAAQNLHLPTLKTCLGMQIVACVLSVMCFFLTNPMNGFFMFHYCEQQFYNETSVNTTCERLHDVLWNIYSHAKAIEIFVQVTQVALSATLAAFCCKVIQCCSPRTSVPTIVVNAPPGPQRQQHHNPVH